MSNSPKPDKARLDLWKADDEELAKLVVELDKKLFSLDAWEVRDRLNNTMVPYGRLVDAANRQYPSGTDLWLLRAFVQYLPEKLRIMKEEMFSVLKRLAVNMEEKMNLVLEQDKHINALLKEIDTIKIESRKEQKGVSIAHPASTDDYSKVVSVVEKMGSELVKLQDQVMSLVVSIQNVEENLNNANSGSAKTPVRKSRREY